MNMAGVDGQTVPPFTRTASHKRGAFKRQVSQEGDSVCPRCTNREKRHAVPPRERTERDFFCEIRIEFEEELRY